MTHPIEQATIVKILPTKVWIESGMFGERYVVLQHEGCEQFDYAVFHYDYRYTSNSSTWNAAERLAMSLNGGEPVEHKQRNNLPECMTREQAEKEMETLREYLQLLDEQTGDLFQAGE